MTRTLLFQAAVVQGGGRASSALRSMLGATGRATSRRRIVLLGSVTGCIGFILAVLAFAARNSFTSDDVAIQNIVASLQAGQPFAPAVGGDNFVVKVPLYLVVSSLIANGTAALIVTVLLCDAPLVAALLLITARVTEGSSRVRTALAFLLVCWFLVSRITAISSLMIPNGRNGEIGVVLLVLWSWLAPGAQIRLRRWVLGGVVLAAVFVSDAFFLYALGPATVAVAVLVVIRRSPLARQAGRVAAAVCGAGALAIAARHALQAAGLEMLQNYINVFPAWRDVPGLLSAAVGAMARNLNGDLVGSPLALAAVPAALQVVLAGVVIVLAIRRMLRPVDDLWAAVLGAVALVNVGLYVGTSNATDPYSFRYVLLAAIAVLLLGVQAVASESRPASGPRASGLLALVGVVAVLVGLALNLRTTEQSVRGVLPDPQERTRAIIQIAQSHGLRLGWGDYWDANITTYMSARRVQVLPLQCAAGDAQPRAWLLNRSDLDQRAPAVFAVSNTALGCTQAVLTRRYGKPDSLERIRGTDDVVLIYRDWRS